MKRMKLFSQTETAIINELAQNTQIEILVELDQQYRFSLELMFMAHVAGMFISGERDGKKVCAIAFNPDVMPKNNLYTIFHEMTHATRETKECHRGPALHCAAMTKEYRKEELVANFSADQLLTLFNFKNDAHQEFINDYHKLYAEGLTDIDVQWAKNEANKAVKYILKNWLPNFANEMQGKAA